MDKSASQVRNAALYDHCNFTSMQVWLNHSRYRSLDMPTDSPRNSELVYTSRSTILLADTIG